MTSDELELLERAVFETVVQALIDYRDVAADVFGKEVDEAKDIAEDMMREAVETMGVSAIHSRLYGKVDYKKAMYVYRKLNAHHELRKIVAACIPNGRLQDRYNPTPEDTIWQVGPDAPSLDEDFRARLNFDRLRSKANWRVRAIPVEQ